MAGERREERSDYIFVAAAALAAVLLVFRRSIDQQLGRLHAPGLRSYSFSDLHGPRADAAASAWREGQAALHVFEPVDARALILQRSGVALALIIVTTVFLAKLLPRLTPSRIPRVLVAAFAVVSGVALLVDISLADHLDKPSNVYDSWFVWLRWLPPLFLVLLVPLAIRPAWKGLRRRGAIYRASPASGRLALGAAIVFVVLFNLGDIGAQLADLLRRDLTSGHWHQELLRLTILSGALALYALVLKKLGDLHVPKGSEPKPWKMIVCGVVLALVGGLVLLAGGQSTLVVLGGIVLAIGLLSWWSKERRVLGRRSQLRMRLAGALLLAGASMFGLGFSLGDDIHEGLLVAGVLAAFAGFELLLAQASYGMRPGNETEPVRPEAAAAIVLLGLGVIVAFPADTFAWAVHIGLAVSTLGLALHLRTRRSFQPEWPGLDLLGVVPVGVGIASVHVWAMGPKAFPWLEHLPPGMTEHWLSGVVLVLLGLLVLRINRGQHVPLPWLDGRLTDDAPDPDGDAAPATDADGTGVLVLALVLPIAGLLIVSVRILGSVLATGGNPPAYLLAFQAVLVAGAVVGSQYINTSAAPPEETKEAAATRRRQAMVILVPVALAAPVLAAFYWVQAWDSVPIAVGRFLRPLSLLILALVGVAAAGGHVRGVFKASDHPAIFRHLGFRRTPVNGLLVLWVTLVMVVASPLEPTAATPHAVRTVPVALTSLSPKPCADKHAILTVIEKRESPVASALCRWIEGVLALQNSPPTLPLVLVTASGGGVRAAAWTTRVLDCLLFTAPTGDTGCPSRTLVDRWPYVFAAGGASGGSVGVATAAAQWLSPIVPPPTKPGKTPAAGWARSVAQPDHVAPVSSQMLITEFGLAPLGIVPGHDRAETLIDSWTEPFGPVRSDRCPALAGRDIKHLGFLQVSAACPENAPLMLFNGTIVRTGGRFDISPLDIPDAGASLGLRDLLCVGDDGPVRDVRFFDAAFLSARFPLVTPSGRLGYGGSDSCDANHPSPVDVVDGGYHENSGTVQIAELWQELRPMVMDLNGKRERTGLPEIRPILIQIENGEISYPSGCIPEVAPGGSWVEELDEFKAKPTPVDDADRSIRLGEPLRVAWAGFLAKVRGRNEEHYKHQLIQNMCRERVPVLTMGLYEHPGREMPLGWSMTDDVLDDLQDVFGLRPNLCRAEAFAAYFTAPSGSTIGPLHCSPGAGWTWPTLWRQALPEVAP